MKRLILLSAFCTILSIIGCTPDISPVDTNPGTEAKASELYRLALREADKLDVKLDVTLDDIRLALYQKNDPDPCESDLNQDGVVNTADLVILLTLYGSDFTTSDLLKLLASFGDDYIRYFLPGLANFAHIKCNGGWNAVPFLYCGGEYYEYYGTDLDYRYYDQDTVLIQTGGDQLEFQTYLNGVAVVGCEGWTPPYNGINTAYLEIEAPDGRIFFNGGRGWVTSTGWVEVIGPVTGGFGDVENLFIGEGFEAEFCTNCN